MGVVLSRTEFTLLISGFCALIWLATDTKRRFLNIRPLVFLGEISYSLYLIHQVVGFAIMRSLLKAGMEANTALLATISLVIGVAACLRAFVEKPAERWIKNFAKPTAGALEALRSGGAASGC